MDIQKALLEEHSKAQKSKIAQYIGKDKKRFQKLWQAFTEGEAPIPQRAAWVLDECTENHPSLFKPYIKEVIPILTSPNHPAINRNLLKNLARAEDIPEELEGDLFSISIDWILDPSRTIAERVFCISLAYNIGKKYPELLEELSIAIKDQMPHGSAGFKSRGRRILKWIDKKSK